MSSFRVLTGDPGTKNFALSVVEYKNGTLRVLGTKMAPHPFRDLSSREAAANLHLFTEDIRELIVKYKVNGLYFERFQVRAAGVSAIEGINVMLGVILYLAHMFQIPSRLITASTWKNNFNNNNSSGKKLDELYKEFKLTSVHSAKAIHEFDGSLIGVYAVFDTLVKSRKPFVNFDPYVFYDSFIDCPKL